MIDTSITKLPIEIDVVECTNDYKFLTKSRSSPNSLLSSPVKRKSSKKLEPSVLTDDLFTMDDDIEIESAIDK